MIIFLLLGLALGGTAVYLAFENTTIVTVVFMHWQFTGTLAVVLLMAILTGVLVTLCILLPTMVGDYFSKNRLGKKVESLEEELRKQKTLTIFAKNTTPTPEVLAAIDKGEILTKEQYQKQAPL